MNVLHIDQPHPYLLDYLEKNAIKSHIDLLSSKEQIEKIILNYQGLILRSRFKIDKSFIDKASHLQFIARVGSGMEHIDYNYAKEKNIKLINAPEANADAVGEHTLGMLLCLFKHIHLSHKEILEGNWPRDIFKGVEIMGKTIGIIGYGHSGHAFAKRLSGFSSKVLYYDILKLRPTPYAREATLKEIFKKAHICSIHISANKENKHFVNKDFIDHFQNPFYLINTARGECLNLKDLAQGIQSNKILGACLDVLEYEKISFQELSHQNTWEMNYLKNSPKVLFTPHIAGLTTESSIRLAKVIAKKIVQLLKTTKL